MISERKNLSQPKDWWAAFAAQAEKEGMTLSAWLGECGLANLSKEAVSKLSDRPPACRPPREKK